MVNFNAVWTRIVQHAGKTFVTVNGKKFTYSVKSNVLRPDHTNRNIPRSDFQKAFGLLPLKGPGQINELVQGPSYVYAILTDPRISGLAASGKS
jgi:hypothetical protein